MCLEFILILLLNIFYVIKRIVLYFIVFADHLWSVGRNTSTPNVDVAVSVVRPRTLNQRPKIECLTGHHLSHILFLKHSQGGGENLIPAFLKGIF